MSKRKTASCYEEEDPGQQKKTGASNPPMSRLTERQKSVELVDDETFAAIQDIIKP